MCNEPNGRPHVVLIADDEKVVRQVTVAMLEREGYTILTAASGEQAIHALEEFPGTVDLALCDIRMPGPSGLELRSLILKQRPETKVVLLSGDTSFNGVPAEVPTLSKPFTVEEFRKRVRLFLGIE